MKKTAEWAIDRAREFIESKGGYSFVQLEKVRSDEKKGLWKVTFNISIFLKELRTVTVRDEDGVVVGFK